MAKSIRERIYSDLQTSIRDLEDNQYLSGVAYWWFDMRDGGEKITPTLLYSKPEHPQGKWEFLAITVQGSIVHEESRMLQFTILQRGGLS